MPFPLPYADLLGGFGNNSAAPPLSDEEQAQRVELARKAGGDPAAAFQGAVDPRASNPPPTLGAGTTVADVPAMSGIPGQDAAGNDDSEGVAAQDLAMRIGLPGVPTAPAGPGATVMPGFENFLPAGGKEKWDEIAQRGGELGRAIDVGAQAEADKSDALAGFFKNEKARQDTVQSQVRARQIENEQAIALQKKQITDATERYTNDLADRGQYWRNPGNILAAIGAMFMVPASDDKAIGIKLIQSQMNADFNQRKTIMDTNLGAMNSNLAAYRQIAGDRDLGDRLAQAEMSRVAAMEVDRIGQQFQGPIAKAKAAAVKQEFLRNYAVQMAQLHAAMIYNAPRVAPVAVANEYGKMASANPQDMHAYTNAKGWQAQVAGQGTASGGKTGPAAGQGVSSYRAEVGKQAQAGGYMTQAQRDLLNKRYPGSADAIDTERASHVRDMAMHIGVDPTGIDPKWNDAQIGAYLESRKPGASKEFNKEMFAYKKWMADDNAEISKHVAPLMERLNGYRRLGRTMRIVEAVAQRTTGGDVDALISTRTNQLVGPSLVKSVNEFLDASQPGSNHEAQAREVADFISNYRQDANLAINKYIKSEHGGTVTEGEEKRRLQFISSDHSHRSLSNFQKLGSSDVQSEAKAAVAGAKSALTATAWNLRIGQETPEAPYRGVAKTPDGPKVSEDNQSRAPAKPAASTDEAAEFFAKNKNAFDALKNLKRAW